MIRSYHAGMAFNFLGQTVICTTGMFRTMGNFMQIGWLFIASFTFGCFVYHTNKALRRTT